MWQWKSQMPTSPNRKSKVLNMNVCACIPSKAPISRTLPNPRSANPNAIRARSVRDLARFQFARVARLNMIGRQLYRKLRSSTYSSLEKSAYRPLRTSPLFSENPVFQESFLFVSLVYWQNGKTRGAPATRWRSSVRVSAWSRGERSRPACGHSVSDG